MARQMPPRGRPVYPGGGYGGYPLYWGGSGGELPSSGVTNNFFMAPPPPFVEEPPAPPARLEVHEYKTDANAQQGAPADEPLFVIALKDGSRISAAAVWSQGGELRAMGPDGDQQRIPLTSIDRTATRDLNRARNLNLRLPPAP